MISKSIGEFSARKTKDTTSSTASKKKAIVIKTVLIENGPTDTTVMGEKGLCDWKQNVGRGRGYENRAIAIITEREREREREIL